MCIGCGVDLQTTAGSPGRAQLRSDSHMGQANSLMELIGECFKQSARDHGCLAHCLKPFLSSLMKSCTSIARLKADRQVLLQNFKEHCIKTQLLHNTVLIQLASSFLISGKGI